MLSLTNILIFFSFIDGSEQLRESIYGWCGGRSPSDLIADSTRFYGWCGAISLGSRTLPPSLLTLVLRMQSEPYISSEGDLSSKLHLSSKLVNKSMPLLSLCGSVGPRSRTQPTPIQLYVRATHCSCNGQIIAFHHKHTGGGCM